MKNSNRPVKVLFIGIIILLSCVLCEVICNIKVLCLDKEEQGIFSVDKMFYSMDGFEKDNEKYVLNGEQGSITWKMDGRYIDKLSYALECEGMEFISTQVDIEYLNEFGKKETKRLGDHNPKLLSNSVLKIKEKVCSITITVQETPDVQYDNLSISDVQIINRVLINPYRIIVVALFAVMICCFWEKRKMIAGHIEYGFCVIALVTGLVMLIAIPTNKVGWDEEVHFKTAYSLSVWPGGEWIAREPAGQLEVTHYNWPYNQPESYEEKNALDSVLDNSYSNGEPATLIEGELGGFSFPAFLFPALFIKIARVLGGSFSLIFFAGRLANLLLYVLVMTFAIRITPVGKRILTFIALTPTSIFQAVVYTYDNFVFSFIMLGVAFILREWLSKDRKVNYKYMIIAYGNLILGILPKAVYAPIVLLSLLIPKEKFQNQKQNRMTKLAGIIIFFLLMASFVVPQLMAPEMKTDVRGGDVDSAEQMSLILGHIPTYISVLFKNVMNTLPDYILGEPAYRALGHLQASGFSFLIPITIILLIFIDQVDGSKYDRIIIRKRICIFVMLAVAIALVWTALYISFTVPGNTFIAGVQGRYYRPLLYLGFIIFENKLLLVNISDKKINITVLALAGIITSVTTIEMFGQFCM